MKNLCIPFLIILFCAACGEKKTELVAEFNDSVGVIDLLALKEYDKLSSDEVYKEYANDYWTNQLDISDVLYHGTEMIGMANINDNNANLQSGASYTLTGVASIGSLGVDMVQAMSLDRDKEKMYASFSESKKKSAEEFEKRVKAIFNRSLISLENPKVKNKDLLVNYKSFKPVIKDDDDLFDELDELTDDVDDLLTLSNEIKTKLNLSLELDKNLDFSNITVHSNKIIDTNGEFEPNTNSTILQKYFDLLSKVTKHVNEIKSRKFTIPIGDWSDEKRENFNFILDDITLKTKLDAKNFDIK